jgi:hypothetical protein
MNPLEDGNAALALSPMRWPIETDFQFFLAYWHCPQPIPSGISARAGLS